MDCTFMRLMITKFRNINEITFNVLSQMLYDVLFNLRKFQS